MGRPGLTNHRKFRRLTRAVGSAIVARGALELLWDASYESGDDYVGSAADIEQLVGWTGETGALTRALAEAGAPEGAGFIEPVDVEGSAEPRYRIHDLWHHAPDYVAGRHAREMERRRPKECHRCGKTYFKNDARSLYCSDVCRKGGWRDRHATAVDGEYPEQGDGGGQTGPSRETDRDGTPAPAPTPALTPAPAQKEKSSSATLTRAEPVDGVPRLEIDNLVEIADLTPKNSSAKRSEDSPIVLTFAVIGTNGQEWHLRAAQVERWRSFYPTLDVLGEARQALAWIDADGRRRKTAGGMTKFLVSWLNRAVDGTQRAPGRTLITGSLKTAGNKEAITEFLRRRGHDVD